MRPIFLEGMRSAASDIDESRWRGIRSAAEKDPVDVNRDAVSLNVDVVQLKTYMGKAQRCRPSHGSHWVSAVHPVPEP